MATIKKYATGGPVPKTAKKPVSTIDKVKKGVSKLTMKDVKDSAESALNLSTLGGYGVAKKKVKELTGMKNGGSLTGLKASNKRVGSVDPKGAYTKVQKKALAGAKGKASLTKDKQLGATKMAKCGTKMSKK
jgi:hypothetical protein